METHPFSASVLYAFAKHSAVCVSVYLNESIYAIVNGAMQTLCTHTHTHEHPQRTHALKFGGRKPTNYIRNLDELESFKINKKQQQQRTA